MKDIHPLKRKSIKPSSSTVRGMLPGPQFRALDAAMQSMRAAGLRLDWQWRDQEIGWVCAGMLDDAVVCELRPAFSPLIGVLELTRANQKKAREMADFPEKFHAVLDNPMDSDRKCVRYEFDLATTGMRDLMSEFVEALLPLYEG